VTDQEVMEGARERHLIAKALCLAIAAIDATEPALQAHSDRTEMAFLLDGLLPGDTALESYGASARRVVRAIRNVQ
jgi:hypothetical protein